MFQKQLHWQHRAKQYYKMAVLIHIHYYLQYLMFDVIFSSETLTWQHQQHNVATSVIMTTNLNRQPPGVLNVTISCVPTVTGTIPDLHQPNNTS